MAFNSQKQKVKLHEVYLSLPGCVFHKVFDMNWWLPTKSWSQSSASGEPYFFIHKAKNWSFWNSPHLFFAIWTYSLQTFCVYFLALERMKFLPTILVCVWKWRLTLNFVHVYLLESWHLTFRSDFEQGSVIKYELLVFTYVNLHIFWKKCYFYLEINYKYPESDAENILFWSYWF